MKTYFGIDIHKHGVKVEDIVMIPHEPIWQEVIILRDDIHYIPLPYWEKYARAYIKKNNLIFPKGEYVCEYTFGETTADKSNPKIIINSKEELEETRNVKLKDEDKSTL